MDKIETQVELAEARAECDRLRGEIVKLRDESAAELLAHAATRRASRELAEAVERVRGIIFIGEAHAILSEALARYREASP